MSQPQSPAAGAGISMVDIDAAGRHLRIEVEWVGRAREDDEPLVFLHEGLGSVSMWRDFPRLLCDDLGRRGLVYSRPGYGRSTARAPAEAWAPDFMHRQALEVLPAVLRATGVDGRYWLFGHSDGGSIALIHAALKPERVAGAVVVAPHICVEDISITSIAAARQAYVDGGLRERLQRHHADVDSAFFGWNDAWLSPAFRDWTIEPLLSLIRCPMLAIQGELDEYGTLAQIEGIARCAPRTRLLPMPDCGHSPHRERAPVLVQAVRDWLAAGLAPG